MQKHPILSVSVSVTNPKDALGRITRLILDRRGGYACVAAVHLLMECQRNKKLLVGVNRADLVVPDGMPLVWFLKAAGLSTVRRVYGPDLMVQLCRFATKKRLAVFLLGGASGQSNEVAHRLKLQFPRLRIAGNRDTPRRRILQKENKEIIDLINKTHPSLVFVGMGCPWQELWMIENRKKLQTSVFVGVGAAFDFISKKVPRAPRWMQEAGLEWLFRFLQEPKRLWRRYTLINTAFVFLLVRDWLRKKLGKIKTP